MCMICVAKFRIKKNRLTNNRFHIKNTLNHKPLKYYLFKGKVASFFITVEPGFGF